MLNNPKIDRLSALVKTGDFVFRDIDLATIWGISNKNTLYTTIKRYNKRKLLEKIGSGIYSIINLKDTDKDMIGTKLFHRYCYISTETVLRNEGIILQRIPHITYISNISKKFLINGQSYSSRQLKDIYLYNKEGIYVKNGVNYATTERAIADILYFNPLYHFDNDRLIDWKKVKKIQKLIGYKNK